MSQLPTPIDSFLKHKADTGMQCGNYSIDIPELKPGQQYRFHFDMTACVGCHCCEVACNEQNGNPAEIKWRRVGEMETGHFPNVLQLFNSMSCNHCIDPACLNGCPTNSYIKLDNGIVYHVDEDCIGCQYCTWNCPYEVPVFHEERGIVTKCHMCVDKLEAGQTPACVQACPAGAIQIEVVDKEEWIRSDMAKEGVAPHLPDISITKPTTRYTLPELPEGEEIRPADEHILKPAHPEFPLVFMTVLTQMSVGGFLALFFGELLHLLGLDLPAPSLWMVLAVLAPAAVGLPLSALHLGRPILAVTAMKNLKTSWLSREAAALGVYAGGVTLLAGIYYLGAPAWLRLLVEIPVAVLGIYGIYAQSMIYRIPARPAWNRKSTTLRFFGTGYLGLLLVAVVLAILGETRSLLALMAPTLMLGMAQMYLIYEETLFYKYLDEENPLYYQLSRTKRLLEEHFGHLKRARLLSLGIFAIALPMLAIVFAAAGLDTPAAWLLAFAFLGATASELLGRYLFYTTVVPLGLAGNFFAGNQRH
ncbi:DmsC/YnfH family molybdoenzyme membrane anchor subunit [Hydrogenimonas urashimensis]|uniref:DmsC/YnfH family molybdoenzyme membrane anchor subunit n=1 Tax=Hydrogenimonas urashimensis TaxID=2740515 RepID=UPI001915A734|nr:DmsC/YnfH family molybdoenzyme membrane anchor subunit [Hydrogenimonas urashimensis]